MVLKFCIRAVFPSLNRISVTVRGWMGEERQSGERERERAAPK